MMDDAFFESFPSFAAHRDIWYHIIGDQDGENHALDERKFLDSRLVVLRGCGARRADVAMLYTRLKGSGTIEVRGEARFLLCVLFFFP